MSQIKLLKNEEIPVRLLYFSYRVNIMSQDGSIPASSQSIINIVKEIENKTLVLPEFQRDFVWTVEQTLDLFDSLVKRIHIGSLIYGKPKFEITVRDFNTYDRKIKKTSRQYLREEEAR